MTGGREDVASGVATCHFHLLSIALHLQSPLLYLHSRM